MGGLHIEIAITIKGREVGVQKGSHTCRGQWAHQVTAEALFVLLHRSYADYQINTPDDEQLHYDEWCKQMTAEHPQFDHWFNVW